MLKYRSIASNSGWVRSEALIDLETHSVIPTLWLKFQSMRSKGAGKQNVRDNECFSNALYPTYSSDNNQQFQKKARKRLRKTTFLVIYSYCMCTSVLPACMYMYHVHAWCLWRLEEGTATSETRVKGSCEHLMCAENQTLFFWRVASTFNHCSTSPVPRLLCSLYSMV